MVKNVKDAAESGEGNARDPNILRKKDLVEHLTTHASLNGKQARAAIEATLAFLSEGLRAEKSIILPPLGKMSTRRVKIGTPDEKTVVRLNLTKERENTGHEALAEDAE